MKKCSARYIWRPKLAIPIAIPGRVSQFGSQRCSASRTASATSSQRKMHLALKTAALMVGLERRMKFSKGGPIDWHATKAHKPPTANSVSGYRQLILALHVRHCPLGATQLTRGMFSHHASVRPQLRQCEGGLTTLSPSGQRLRHTFRKLP